MGEFSSEHAQQSAWPYDEACQAREPSSNLFASYTYRSTVYQVPGVWYRTLLMENEHCSLKIVRTPAWVALGSYFCFLLLLLLFVTLFCTDSVPL